LTVEAELVGALGGPTGVEDVSESPGICHGIASRGVGGHQLLETPRVATCEAARRQSYPLRRVRRLGLRVTSRTGKPQAHW
jgi:hypothetical protein